MNIDDSMIMVVNRTSADAENLKRLIEFMDVNTVCAAKPDRWRQAVGGKRLEAIFVGSDLSDKDVHTLLGEVCDLDPNVPVVMIRDNRATC